MPIAVTRERPDMMRDGLLMTEATTSKWFFSYQEKCRVVVASVLLLIYDIGVSLIKRSTTMAVISIKSLI